MNYIQKFSAFLKGLSLTDIKIAFQLLKNSKFSKFFTLFLASFIGFFLVLSFCLSFIDIQQYVPMLEKQVLEKTGKVLAIQGPIKLNTFPKLGISLQELSLKEHTNSKFPLLTAQSIKCYPNLFYLLIGKIAFKIEVKDFRYKSYFIPDFISKIRFNDDLLILKSSKINLSQNKIEKWMNIDHLAIYFKNETPQFFLKHQSNDFPTSTLLQILDSKTSLSGNTKVNLELTSEGKTSHHIKKHLAGAIQVEIEKGKFHGLDLLASLKEAKSLVETVASTVSHSVVDLYNAILHRKVIPHGITPFDHIKIHLEVKNGIVSTKDLKISHKHYFLDGIGHINLIKNSINYQIKALYKEHGTLTQATIAKPELPHIKVSITGPIENPSIKPDLSSYFHYVRSGGSEIQKPKSKVSLPSFKKIIKSISG